MTTFADLGLSPSTVQAVTDTGYTVPTPIQEQAIPVALAGRDVLGIAQTGTGKTAAFTLPMIDRLGAGRAKARMPRSLVVCPTRELADQVAGSFDKYAKGTKLSWALLIGGVSFKDQEMKIDRGVDVLIATPGRLLDFYERRKIMLLDVKTLVVDEADRMLDMGFIPDLEKIFEITPKQKQTLFFSATMPPEITRLTSQFLKDPTRIEVARPATTNENIKQFVAKLPMNEPKAKRMALRALIERAAPESGIIFCNRKSEVDIVAKSLQKYGYDAAPIHGDLDQSQRTKTLEAFRAGELKLLVASDVAARGLDIPQVSDIFNYDVPHQADDYVHRIGRTGRAGRLGEAFMIVTPADDRSYDKVLKLTKDEPEEITLELDWEEAKRGAERDRERFGSGRGRDREGGRGRESGRGRGRDRDQRDRPVADHGQRASMEAISVPEPGEAAPVETPSPRREPRPERTASRPEVSTEEASTARPDAAPERGEREDRPRRDRGPRREREEPAARVEREEPPRRAERDEAFGRRGERDRDRGPRTNGAGGRDRDRFDRDDRPVLGFGDDTPAFMLRSAAAAIAALQAPDEPEEVETTFELPEVRADEEPRAERGRSRRRRGRKGEGVSDEAGVTEAASDEDAALDEAVTAETEAAETAVSEPPPKPKRTRRRKADETAAPAVEALPAAEPEVASEELVAATLEAPKPKRVRKPKAAADAEPAPQSEVAAEAPAKPKRMRKPAAAAEAAAAEADAPLVKPKRSRKKAAEVAEEAADTLPPDVIPG